MAIKKRNLRAFGMGILTAIAIIAVLFLFVDVIPPRAATLTAMDETSTRLSLYYSHNHELPQSLSVLPKREGYLNRITDGWDRQLIYSPDAPAMFTLSSLGKDGALGGIGDDRDIVQRYRIAKGTIEELRD